MNAQIEVVAAEATMTMTVTKVIRVVRGFFAEVVFTTQVVATSILRVLKQGNVSISAVAPDYIRNGGTAVAV